MQFMVSEAVVHTATVIRYPKLADPGAWTTDITESAGPFDWIRLVSLATTVVPIRLYFRECPRWRAWTGRVNAADTTGWAGASPTSAGTYTPAEPGTTFTVATLVSGTIGAGTTSLSWSDLRGGSGTLDVGSSYTPGAAIPLRFGTTVALAAGSAIASESFSIAGLGQDDFAADYAEQYLDFSMPSAANRSSHVVLLGRFWGVYLTGPTTSWFSTQGGRGRCPYA